MQLEEIKISISAETEQAIKALSSLSSALKVLKNLSKNGADFTPVNQAISKFATGVQNISNKTVDKLDKIANAFEKLNGAKISPAVAKSISDLGGSVDGSVSGTFEQIGTEVSEVGGELEKATSKAEALEQRLNEIEARHNNWQPRYAEESPEDIATAQEIQAEVDAEQRLAVAIDNTTQAVASANSVKREPYGDMTALELQERKVQVLIDKYSELAGAEGTSESQLISLAQQIQSAQAKYNKLADAQDKDTQATNRNTQAKERSNSATKKHTGALGKLAATFKRILLYRAIRGIITGVGKAFGEAAKNLYDYSRAMGNADGSKFAQTMDNYASMVLQLKNSLVTALAPAISAIMPYLQKLAGYVIQAANAIARFFAILNGQSTYTVAKEVATTWGDSAADSIGGANSAAEELKRTLLGFDEINALDDPNKGGSGGGGGGGGSSVSASDMFEEVQTTPLTGIWGDIAAWIDELKPIISEIVGYLKEIWNSPLVQAVVKTTLKVAMGIVSDALQVVADVLGIIADILNGDWSGAIRKIGHLFIDLGDLVVGALYGAFKIVATGFYELYRAIGNGIADLFEEIPFIGKQKADEMREMINNHADSVLGDIEKWGKDIDKTTQMRKLTWDAVLDGIGDSADEFYTMMSQTSAENVDKLYQAYKDGRAKIEEDKIVFDCDGDGVFETIVRFKKDYQDAKRYVETNPAKIYADNSSALATILGTRDYDVWYKNWVENNPWQIYANARSAYNTVDNFVSYWKKINLQRELGVRVEVTNANGRLVSGGLIFETKAEGGLVNAGQIFIAREAGPEMVGTIGRQTAVANNDQIISGIASGVATAMSSQNALLSEQNSLLKQILMKPSGVSTASIIDGLNRTNRRAGTPIIAMG